MTKFENIRALLFDVDGVLTDGGIYYDSEGNEFKKFNVKDGQICSVLKSEGFILGIITGRKSTIVEKRFKELKFDYINQGCERKDIALEDFMKKFDLHSTQIAYTGDDINDLSVFPLVGFSCCPQDARNYIKNKVDYVTPNKGGDGVLRDVADLILEKINKLKF